MDNTGPFDILVPILSERQRSLPLICMPAAFYLSLA